MLNHIISLVIAIFALYGFLAAVYYFLEWTDSTDKDDTLPNGAFDFFWNLPNADPFKRARVQLLEVKDGWVKYRHVVDYTNESSFGTHAGWYYSSNYPFDTLPISEFKRVFVITDLATAGIEIKRS